MLESPQFDPEFSSREEYIASLKQYVNTADQVAQRRETFFTLGSKLLITIFLCVLAITIIHWLIPVKPR